MKNKITCLLLIFILCLPTLNVYANENKSFDVKEVSVDGYTIKINIVHNSPDVDVKDKNTYVGEKISNYYLVGTVYKGNDFISPFAKWENPDYVIQEGEQIVNIICSDTPDGEIKFGVYIYGIVNQKKEALKKQLNEDAIVDTSTLEKTTLTASTIILSEQTAYDINVLNKPEKANYKYTSSDLSVVKVNAKSGLVTSVGEGEAVITCLVTTPTENYSLTSDVVVTGGEDDSYPTLNADELNLEVGDMYDIDVENNLKNSKVRYSSSNKEIATVTSISGKVKAVGIGSAVIKCTIVSPDNTVVILISSVTVK